MKYFKKGLFHGLTLGTLLTIVSLVMLFSCSPKVRRPKYDKYPSHEEFMEKLKYPCNE